VACCVMLKDSENFSFRCELVFSFVYSINFHGKKFTIWLLIYVEVYSSFMSCSMTCSPHRIRVNMQQWKKFKHLLRNSLKADKLLNLFCEPLPCIVKICFDFSILNIIGLDGLRITSHSELHMFTVHNIPDACYNRYLHLLNEN